MLKQIPTANIALMFPIGKTIYPSYETICKLQAFREIRAWHPLFLPYNNCCRIERDGTEQVRQQT